MTVLRLQPAELATDLDLVLDRGRTISTFESLLVQAKSAGYTIEPYGVINGVPVAASVCPVSLAPRVEVSGYESGGPSPLDPNELDLDADARYVPSLESFDGLTWAPTYGYLSHRLNSTGSPVVYLGQDAYAVEIQDDWYPLAVLDLDDGAYLTTGLLPTSSDLMSVAMVACIHPSDEYGRAGVMGFGSTTEGALNVAVFLTEDDEIELRINAKTVARLALTGSYTGRLIPFMLGLDAGARKVKLEVGLQSGVKTLTGQIPAAVQSTGVLIEIWLGKAQSDILDAGTCSMEIADVAWWLGREPQDGVMDDLSETYGVTTGTPLGEGQ